MKIRIEDLHLIGFYFLILTEADLSDEENLFFPIKQLEALVTPCTQLVVNMVEEIEQIMLKNKY